MYDYKKLLSPHERVYFFGGVHWMTMASSLCFCFLLAFIGFSMLDYIDHGGLLTAPNPMQQATHDQSIGYITTEATHSVVIWFYKVMAYVPWALILFGVLWVIKDTIHYICTKVLLTSQRVVIKRGLLGIRIHEIELVEIEAANVNQLTFGRLLGYGTIHLDARLVEDYDLPIIGKPYKFVKTLHILKDHDIQSHHNEERKNNAANGTKSKKTLSQEDLDFLNHHEHK